MIRILLIVTAFLPGCASWDSNKFEQTQAEMALGNKVKTLEGYVSSQLGSCKKLGSMKLNAISRGQPPGVVAVRKYPKSNLIKLTADRIDGGLDGEFPAKFYDVYRCERD